MPDFHLQRLMQGLVSSTCAISLAAAPWAPTLAALESSSLPPAWQTPGADPAASSQAQRLPHRPGAGGARPAGRPAPAIHHPGAHATPRPGGRPGGPGAGGAAITRPAPGLNQGNRPAGGWGNNGPVPHPAAGPTIRPALPPAVNRPGLGRPDRPVLRPTPSWPNGNHPLAPLPNRPGWNGPIAPLPNRPAWNRPGWNRPNWVLNRPVNINTINVRPSWWGPGWAGARPWRYGWYSGIPSSWGWWPGSSLAWGVTSLASAAIIAAAINNAVRDNNSAIDVTDSPYQLLFGSVSPEGEAGVSFRFLLGGEAYEASADCQRGWLNGRAPENPEEAQLIHAACQVAYANF